MKQFSVKNIILVVVTVLCLWTVSYLVFTDTGYISSIFTNKLQRNLSLIFTVLLVLITVWLVIGVTFMTINKDKYKEDTRFALAFIAPIIISIVLVLIILGLYTKTWYSNSIYNKKYPTKEAVTNAYIEFAIKGNKKGLITIAAPDHVIDETINNKVKLYTNYKQENLQIDYTESPSSNLWRISIKGANTDSSNRKTTFQDEIFVQYFSNSQYFKGRWYLVLGYYNNE